MRFIILVVLVVIAVHGSNRKWSAVLLIGGCTLGGLLGGGLLGYLLGHTPEAAGSMAGLLFIVMGYIAAIKVLLDKRPPTYPSSPALPNVGEK